MRFSIGSIDFEISARRWKIVRELKNIYNGDIQNRVATIRHHREMTGSDLRDAIIFCNENVFEPEDRVKSVMK